MIEKLNSNRSNNLPAPVSTFIGREKEILKVKRLILDNRLVTLTGSGGSGKTRLALQIAHELTKVPKYRIWFVELASLHNPSLIPQKIASTLDIREKSTRPILDSLFNYLSAHPSLLLLDNCEHLIEACAEIVEILLQNCANLKILATSREVLGITGEVAWTVSPLSLPVVQPWKSPTSPQEALRAYQKSESVQLFTDRAATNNPEFILTSKNGVWVAEICRRLDGMPLAIELAAARVRALSVKQIAERLDDRFNLLMGGSRTAHPRHQTLEATIDWSYTLLSESEQKLLQRFSVFPGGGTLEAIESVCMGKSTNKSEVLDILSQLVDKSLVVVNQKPGKRRYSLLETIREFALEILINSQDVNSTKDRHLDFFLQFAEEAEPKIKGPEQLVWYERLETEHDNLRAALDWALESKNADAGLRLAGSLGFFWFVRGYLREGVVWLERVLKNTEGAPPSSQAKALRFLGSLLIFSEDKDFERISTFLEKSLELYRELDDRAGIAWVLTQLGIAAAIQGELIKANKFHGESLALRLEVGNPWDIAQSLGNLASLAIQQKDNTSGKQFAESALAWFQKAGDQRSIARITGDLAWIAGTEGDFSDAIALQTKSLAQLVQFGDDWSCAELLEGLANWAYEQGNSKRTAILLGAAEALRENAGMPLQGNEYDFYKKDLVTFWKKLGRKKFANAWAQGRAMTLEQVVNFVLQDSEVPQPVQIQKESIGGLTTREREAAILISQGKSNREIAKAMTVTVKTVEAYVTRILRKLGFDSRVKIATWVIDNDLS